MKVPYFVPEIGPEEMDAVAAVLRSGWLTTGSVCREFEQRFAESVGAPMALALNSCTAALHLALEAVGVGPGDHVLVPSLTFAASAEVVRYRDAVPVFVDSQLSDCNMSVDDVQRACSELEKRGTPPKAIICVHYGGKMVDIVAIRAIADAFGAKLIEDAAHAFPASVDSPSGRVYPGSLSDAACFSFYANKTITTGEGGMVVCRDPALMARMRVLALHGIDRDAFRRYSENGSWYYEIIAPGYKYNMPDVTAAIGVAQLGKATAFREAREQVARWYFESLRDNRNVYTLEQTRAFHNAWHLFTIRIAGSDGSARNRLIAYLQDHGITVSVHWTPLHKMPYYIETYGSRIRNLPNAELLGRTLISLPIFPSMTREQVSYVAAVVKSGCAEIGIGQTLGDVVCSTR